MRSGTKEVHWDTPMPGATSRYHSPANTSDSLAHLQRAAARKPGAGGVVCADVNVRCFTTKDGHDVVIGGHWFSAGRNGYTDLGDRRLTAAEKKRALSEWTYADLKRLRRPNGDPVMEWHEIVEWCALHGLIPCSERKDPEFGQVKWARLMNDACRTFDVPDWGMALLQMQNCRAKSAAAFAAGGQFAVILGNRWRSLSRQLPAGWPWSPQPMVWNSHAKWWERTNTDDEPAKKPRRKRRKRRHPKARRRRLRRLRLRRRRRRNR